MLTISARLQQPRVPDARLVLPFEMRSRSRFRARLVGGEEVGVILARGQILRDGDLLLASDGRVIEISAASETLSTVRSADPRWLARAAYHLGNRHVALQIGEGWLRYSHDHVLDQMLHGLGLEVTVEQALFEPEAGAYHSGGDSGRGDGHIHTHVHDH
ncbi:MAG TPA: urease accessory protein UreE [Steroidobacteraceae bacterium]|nr:urease accessory protein UreE [Steroidobacteraceae bacterium]